MTKNKINKNIRNIKSINLKTVIKKGIFIEGLFLLAIIISFIYFLNRASHIQDDAFITFRYIKNFIDGKGLVFNIGERVEGYTNFLWMIILIVPAFLKVNIIDASQFLSSFFGLSVLIVTYFISRSINLKSHYINNKKDFSGLINLVPVFLLALSGAFSYWASSGMETSFFIFLILTGLFFYIRNDQSEKINYYTPIFISLATLTRPEGILFFVIIYSHKIFFIIIRQRKSSSLLRKVFSRNNLLEVSFFILPVLIHLIFRLIYYGYLLPNTYYAKVNYDYSTFESGLEYLLLFAQDYLLYGIIFILPLFLLAVKELRFETSLFYLIIFLYSLYVIIIGGDVLPLHRFWLIVLPLIYILWGMFLIQINIIYSKRSFLTGSKRIAILLIITILIGYYNYNHSKDKISTMKDREIALVSKFRMYAEIINGLERIKKRRLTIAVSTIGSLSYFTNATVIDMLGLTDEYIAHNPEIIPEISNDPENPWKEKRYNTSYVISREPDYILFSTDTKPSAYAERALFTNNDFFYYYYIQFIPRPQGQHVYFYARKTNQQIKLSNPEIKSIKINANWVKDYINLCQKYYYFQKFKSQERFKSVKIQFDRTIKSGPSFFADTYRIMGDVYFVVGDINKAKSNYDKALLKDSLNVLSYLGLSRIYQKFKDEKKANFYIREIQTKGLVQEGLLHM